jgi:hypothetical protein
MSAPLSNKQKADLCQLYRRAYDYQLDRGALGDAALLEDFRHGEQLKAVGKQSLTSCTQDDFPVLMAHGCKLAGEDGDALYWLNRAATNPRRCALLKLEEACQEAGVWYPDYPRAICQTQFKCRLDDATAKQLWCLVFTLRNRRHAQHRGAA